MIELKNIEKSFGKLSILKGVSASLEKGKIYAFLGPNGSGKTTLIKIILGMVKANTGDIRIQNKVVNKDWKYRENIGYMPQIARFPENLKVSELFRMIKDLRNSQIDESSLVAYFNLQDALDKKLKNLSGGTKQKVNAILTFMFDLDILILDEPSVGLDPISHFKLKELINQEREKGKTILLVTHILSDVEEMADEILFLMDGKIHFQGSPEKLLASQNESRLDKAIAKLTDKKGFEAVVKQLKITPKLQANE